MRVPRLCTLPDPSFFSFLPAAFTALCLILPETALASGGIMEFSGPHNVTGPADKQLVRF